MHTGRIKVASDIQAELGEGPVWDTQSGCLSGMLFQVQTDADGGPTYTFAG